MFFYAVVGVSHQQIDLPSETSSFAALFYRLRRLTTL